MYYIQIKPEKSYSLKLEWIVSGDDTEKTDSGMDSHHFSFLCHFICVLSLNLLRRTKILTNLTKSPFEIVYFTRQQTVVTGRIIQIGRNNGGRQILSNPPHTFTPWETQYYRTHIHTVMTVREQSSFAQVQTQILLYLCTNTTIINVLLMYYTNKYKYRYYPTRSLPGRHNITEQTHTLSLSFHKYTNTKTNTHIIQKTNTHII